MNDELNEALTDLKNALVSLRQDMRERLEDIANYVTDLEEIIKDN